MPDKMSRLSDFKPLRQVEIPGLGDLDCSGLIVLVGPNSSGKSHLLQDIHKRISGEPRQLVVASQIQINKPPLDSFLQCLEDEGYFSSFQNEFGAKQLRPRTMLLGTGLPVSQLALPQVELSHQNFNPEDPYFASRPSDFLQHFGRLLVTALFLDRRLMSLNSVGVIDFQSQTPTHDFHALHINDEAQDLLQAEMISSFGKAVWLDQTRGSEMSLKVSDMGFAPSHEDRLSHKKMSEYRSIETEGDGMKSYAAICMTLLLGQRPLCLVDEPEMCLHPPQAYNLGRFIGKYGSDRHNATIVATHSSHFLRGVIQSTQDVQIVRLTRINRKFSAHLVAAEHLNRALARPSVRAEIILDGIFAQAVVVVEADSDRLVYGATWETVQNEFGIDIHFSNVGGSGGIAEPCKLYRTLNIPITVIADLDFITDNVKMSQVLEVLVSDLSTRNSLIQSCDQIAAAISKIPPRITPADAEQELSSILENRFDWNHGADIELCKRLSRLRNDVDRKRSLKHGNLTILPLELRNRIDVALDELKKYGLFLVPIGELEQWVSELGISVSTSDKPAWAVAAAQAIQVAGRREGDIWEFISGVGRYVSLTQIDPSNSTHSVESVDI